MGRPLGVDMANLDEERPKKAAKPVDGCWFCLSNPNADVELVASIGEALPIRISFFFLIDRLGWRRHWVGLGLAAAQRAWTQIEQR